MDSRRVADQPTCPLGVFEVYLVLAARAPDQRPWSTGNVADLCRAAFGYPNITTAVVARLLASLANWGQVRLIPRANRERIMELGVPSPIYPYSYWVFTPPETY
jgi:hypothetical protein